MCVHVYVCVCTYTRACACLYPTCSQYIAASKESYGFSIEDGVLRTEAGFDTAFSANILYEELAYSKVSAIHITVCT